MHAHGEWRHQDHPPRERGHPTQFRNRRRRRRRRRRRIYGWINNRIGKSCRARRLFARSCRFTVLLFDPSFSSAQLFRQLHCTGSKWTQRHVMTYLYNLNLYIYMWIYIERFCKKNPKRAACASLVEREEKGFEVAPKRWKRKTIVSKVSRKWVPVEERLVNCQPNSNYKLHRLRMKGVHLHTPALQTGTHFLLTLETIVFLFHLLGATSKPFPSLSTRLAHAARLGFFLQKRAI